MKIIVLSDLHIKEVNDWGYIKQIISDMMHRICNKLQGNEKVLFVILGDVINSDQNNTNETVRTKYSEASKFIELLSQEYNNSLFLFVPGNHDIFNNNIEEFNYFLNRHSFLQDCNYTVENSIFNLIEENISIILVDSNLSRNYNDNGRIDENLLRDKLEKDSKNLVFMHHPPCRQQTISGSSDKAIENSADLIATHCNFVFYGHQHGDYEVLDFFEKDTDIHALGSFLVKESGVKNDFIMLDIKDGQIHGAYRYNYIGKKFVRELLFPNKTELKSHKEILDKPEKNLDVEIPITRFYRNNFVDKKQDINDIVKNNDYIIISGIAGVGKSYELRNIYWQFVENEEYFPIWLNLKNVNYELAKRYIEYAINNTFDNKDVILIIDGLSEITGNMFKNISKDISSVRSGGSGAKVIISKRDSLNSLPEGFKLFNMMPFEDNDIVNYAKQNNIVETDDFIDCLCKTECKDIAKTAFYLVEIVELYKKNKCLPRVDELMNMIILRRLKDSDDKISKEFEKSLIANEYTLRNSFEELGFMLQAIQKYNIENNFYTRIFDINIRALQKDAGIIKRNELDCSCEFEHDIFREYFVAKYLCNLSLNDLLKHISIAPNTSKIRSSWIKIIDFLLIMRNDSDLNNWLLTNCPEIFYQLESTKISSKFKDDSAKLILDDCFNKNLPIHTVYSDVEKFTKYFQSEATLDFMIDRLNGNLNEYTISSIIQILQYMTTFYGKEDAVYNVLMKILRNEYPEYIFGFTLKALANVMASDINTLVDDLTELMRDKKDISTIKAFFKILSGAQNTDNYIDLVIDRHAKVDRSIMDIGFDESFFSVMNAFTKTDSILKCIEYVCKSDVLSREYQFSNFLEGMIDKVADIYKKGDNEFVFDRIYQIFLVVSIKYNKKKAKIVQKFFIETHTENKVLEKILGDCNLKNQYIYFILEDFMEPSFISLFAEYYCNEKIDDDLFIWYAKKQPIDSTNWNKLNDSYKLKKGESIEREIPANWENLNFDATQRYFNSLFDLNDYIKLIECLEVVLQKDIIIDTFFDELYSKISMEKEELQFVGEAIYHYAQNKNIAMSEFVENVNWEYFQLIEIFKLIESNSKLEISDQQNQFLKCYFDRTVETIKFDEIMKRNRRDDSELLHAKNIVLLVNKLKYICPDEVLLQMLMLPWYIFSNSISITKSPTLQFISENIYDKELLRSKILFNIKNVELSGFSAQTHILYCLDNNIADAVKISVDLFCNTNADDNYLKKTAVNYLIKYKGEQFVDKLITETCDIDLLQYLASTIKNNNQNLIRVMLKANSESSDKMFLISYLIKLNNIDGLERYIEFITKYKAIPEIECCSEHTNSVTRVTMSIREVRDVSLLEQVKKLLICAYSKGFNDIETWGLRGSLNHAISNLIQEDKKKVAEMLEDLTSINSSNEELKFICNYHLQQIKELSSFIEETPWNFDQAYEFIKSRRES